MKIIIWILIYELQEIAPAEKQGHYVLLEIRWCCVCWAWVIGDCMLVSDAYKSWGQYGRAHAIKPLAFKYPITIMYVLTYYETDICVATCQSIYY